MDDLISRGAAIDALITAKKPKNKGDGTIDITIFTDAVIRDVINKIPNAHPEPPKIGKWIKNGNKYTCPFCGTGFTTVSEEVRSAHKYCYYCGAKMEG